MDVRSTMIPNPHAGPHGLTNRSGLTGTTGQNFAIECLGNVDGRMMRIAVTLAMPLVEGRSLGGVSLAGCCSLGCLTQSVSFGRLLCFVKPRLWLEQWSQANTVPVSPTGPHLGLSMWLSQPSLLSVLAALS